MRPQATHCLESRATRSKVRSSTLSAFDAHRLAAVSEANPQTVVTNPAPLTGSQRVALSRKRKRKDIVFLGIELLVTARNALIRIGILNRAARNDKKAVREALYAFLDRYLDPETPTTAGMEPLATSTMSAFGGIETSSANSAMSANDPKRTFFNCVATEQHRQGSAAAHDVVVAARAKAAATVCNTGRRELGRQSGDALVWQAKGFFREGEAGRYNEGTRTRLGV
jgi:hypothetical protein